MLKRFALIIAATAAVAFPATGALAAPSTSADGIAPDEACFAAIPAHAQPLLCGRGNGGPGSA